MLPTTKLRNNHKGVTLVEVIAVIAVLSVVMAAVVGFMISGARMSAKVSGGATAGMREQTAVEFINKELWKADIDAVSLDAEVDEDSNPTGKNSLLRITTQNDLGETREQVLTFSNGKVSYNGVELCDGTIYFTMNKSQNTITYTLNGVEHVVHLRITASDSGEESTN